MPRLCQPRKQPPKARWQSYPCRERPNPRFAILGAEGKEKDPVCGMLVSPEKAAGKFDYQGKTYYFCCTRCAKRFAADPEKFLAAPGTARMEPNASSAANRQPARKGIRYTCPMDPEIVQIGPGTCPKCGMALEPMDIVAGGAS